MKTLLSFMACSFSLFLFSVSVHAIPYTSSFVGAVTDTFFTSNFPAEIIQPGDKVWGDYSYDLPGGNGGPQELYFNLNVEVLSGDLTLTYWGSFVEGGYEVWMSGTYPELDVAGVDVGWGGIEMGKWYRDNHGIDVIMSGDQDIYSLDFHKSAFGSGSITGGLGTGDIYRMDPITGQYFNEYGMYEFSYDFYPAPEPKTFILFGVGLALMVNRKNRRRRIIL